MNFLGTVRYFYRQLGPKHKLTVAYRYDTATGKLSYGASMFRQDRVDETFIKSEHRHTASERLNKCPVRLQIPANLRYAQVEDVIRQAVIDKGVRGERLPNDGKIALPKKLPPGVMVCVGLDPNWPGNERYEEYSVEKILS